MQYCLKFMQFYLDTCIWLNLFKKETYRDAKLWFFAKEFIEKVVFSESDQIVYSGLVLRELQIKLSSDEFVEKVKFLKNEPGFVQVEVLNIDKVEARKLESFYNFGVSFYDLVHLMICKRLSLVLVTRDKQLLFIANEQGVIARKPEEL